MLHQHVIRQETQATTQRVALRATSARQHGMSHQRATNIDAIGELRGPGSGRK